MYGSLGAASGEGGERREGGKRGRRPGRKAQSDKQDMKAKLGWYKGFLAFVMVVWVINSLW